MRLGAKLTLWVLIPLILALSTLAAVTLRREQEVHQRNASEQADRIARVLAIPVGDALRRAAPTELAGIVARAGLSPSRFGLVTYDAAGQPLMRWGLHTQAAALDSGSLAALGEAERGRSFTEELDGLAVRSHLVALTGGSRLLGALKVSLSLSEAHRVLEGERWSFLGMLSLLSVALAVLISVTIRRQVGLPLARLMSGITTLASGGKLEDIAISGRDEVAQVAREFNYLGRRLDEARSRLLRESEYARNVIESITDGIIGIDRDGIIRTWNRAMVERNGIPEAEVLGANLWTTFPAFEREGLRTAVEQLLDGTQREVDLRYFEHESLRRGRVVLNIRGSAVRGATEGISGAVLAIEDVTERVALTQELQQAEKLAVIGQLAAGIAHQIGTPLNVISGSAEYLMMEWGTEKPRPAELQIIVAQTDRITKLIQQLLNFARPARIELAPLSLNDLMGEVLGLVEHQVAKERIVIQTDFQRDLPAIHGDLNQLEQAVLNIMINAWHAMPEGGVLTLRTRATAAGDRPRRPGRAARPGVEAIISDTGTGIAPEHMPRIFDPFFSTKGVGKGTGLGLAISRRIVEDHRGSIEVVTEVGRGTTFTIWLPAGEQTI